MNDLNKLLKDFYDNRLSYKQVYQAKFEALLSAIVEDVEGLKALASPPRVTDLPAETVAAMAASGPGEIVWVDGDKKPVKRGPGRPPKDEANG